MSEKAVITGIGETPVGKLFGRSSLGLQADAVIQAVADAGLEPHEVDAVYALGPYAERAPMHALGLVERLGMRPRVQLTCDVGGTVSFMEMSQLAVDAIGQGRAKAAVCVFGENASTRRAAGSHGFDKAPQYGTEEFEDRFGAASVVVLYAMAARRYLDRYGLDPTDTYFPIAQTLRRHAGRNPNAAYREPYDLEEYLASPIMADPLRRLDCSPVVDGAGAFVVASPELAGRSSHAPVSVLGMAQRSTHKIGSQMPDLDDMGMWDVGREVFERAGVSPSDVDLATVHDGFSSSIPLTLEPLGLMEPGKTGAAAAEGALDLGGALPTNTNGGLLSQGHAGGVLHVVEIVRQLRHEAEGRQVEGAQLGVTAGNGGVFSVCGAMVLGRGA